MNDRTLLELAEALVRGILPKGYVHSFEKAKPTGKT